jgi:hypothetical protein
MDHSRRTWIGLLRSALGVAVSIGIAPAGEPSVAAEYYVDGGSGSDRNAGTSPAAALRSLAQLARLKLQAGDVVRPRRGSMFRRQVAFQGSGLRGRPIRIGAYGEGPKAEILGSIQPQRWEQVTGELYRVKIPEDAFIGDRAVCGVFEYPPGGAPVRLAGSHGSKRPPVKRGGFHYDAENRSLAAPRFASDSDGCFCLAADSPAIDANADVGLPFTGKAPDIGWHERGKSKQAPKYPARGKDDDAAVLYLWGEAAMLPRKEVVPPGRFGRVLESSHQSLPVTGKGT